jgi:hypothetical protein
MEAFTMRRLSLVLMAALLTVPVLAQERIDLTTAEIKPANNQYRIERMIIQFDDPATSPADEGALSIELLGQNGEPVSCSYTATTSPTATFLTTALNKANLSTTYAANTTTGSLKQRIYHRLVVMGESTVICGKTITGTLAGVVP